MKLCVLWKITKKMYLVHIHHIPYSGHYNELRDPKNNPERLVV